jgi:phage baseplate assembly protein V
LRKAELGMINDGILRSLLAPPDDDGRLLGVVVGIVTNNRDPDGMHRVKVRFPWLSEHDESHWARVATPMAGGKRGCYFLPEVDDEVLVAFEHGSMEHAFIVGALWNGADAPPESNDNGSNDQRSITSRSGHVIRLGDAAGSESVEIIDKTGNNRIVIHSADNKITVEAQGDIEITSSTGKLKMSAVGIEINSQTDVKIQAQTTMDVKANAQISVQGALVKIN